MDFINGSPESADTRHPPAPDGRTLLLPHARSPDQVFWLRFKLRRWIAAVEQAGRWVPLAMPEPEIPVPHRTNGAQPGSGPDSRSANRINPVLDRLAGISWRVIVISIVGLAALWLLQQVRVVFFPVVVALFLARALSPVSGWLQRHRWRPGLAAITSMVGFFVVLGGVIALAVPSFADEIDSIGPTLTAAIDDVEDWLVEDSPIQVSRETIDELRVRAGEEIDRLLNSQSEGISTRATLVAEIITGTVLAFILTFFMLRDGKRFTNWLCGRVNAGNQIRLRRSLDASWSTLAGYLRGATLLGVVESVLIGATLWIAGGGLIAPVMLVTFLGAFVPLVGAVGAGVIAVLVALVTGGTSAAIAVGIVAVLVQQFDNDLLAPVIYGRALNLHPVAILLGVVTGGALFGIVGTVLAVPVIAVLVNAAKAFRVSRLEMSSGTELGTVT